MHKALKYLLLSQTCFLFFVLICFVLKADEFFKNAALSYYGTNSRTIIPYAAGILSAAYFLFKSSSYLGDIAKKEIKIIKVTSQILAILLIGDLLTPYSINWVFFILHMIQGAALFLTVLLVSIYIVLFIDTKLKNILILSGELIFLTILILSLGFIDVLHLQATAQLVINLLFILLLFNTLKDLLSAPQAKLR